MVREAFVTRKRFLGFPKVSCARWIGTIKHGTMPDDDNRTEQAALVLWLDDGNCESNRIYGALLPKMHVTNTKQIWTTVRQVHSEKVNKNTS